MIKTVFLWKNVYLVDKPENKFNMLRTWETASIKKVHLQRVPWTLIHHSKPICQNENVWKLFETLKLHLKIRHCKLWFSLTFGVAKQEYHTKKCFRKTNKRHTLKLNLLNKYSGWQRHWNFCYYSLYEQTNWFSHVLFCNAVSSAAGLTHVIARAGPSPWSG